MKQAVEALIALKQQCPENAAEYLDICFGAGNASQELGEVVDRILGPILSGFKALVICIDGVELCDDDERDKIWDGIRKLLKRNHFKVIVAARDDLDLSEILPGPIAHIQVDRGSNLQDIRTYIDDRLLVLLGPNQVFNDADFRCFVQNTLIEKSGGMQV